jgi:hypothetical protein
MSRINNYGGLKLLAISLPQPNKFLEILSLKKYENLIGKCAD